MVSSVLPTPVGPEKTKLAMGRLGFFRPTRARRMAREIALTASSWPMTLWCRVSSILRSLSDSVSVSLLTGTPVQDATMWAMSSSVTTGDSVVPPASSVRLLWAMARISALISISRSRSSPALSKSWERTALSLSLRTVRSSRSNSFAAGGSWELINRTREPASSIRSMALSGRKRSEM